MNPVPMRALREDEIQTYRRDGIVLLEGLFDPGWVEHLRPLVDADMSAPGPLHLELEAPDADGDGRFFFDTFLWPRSEGFRRFVLDSPAAAICGQLMGASKVNIFFDQLLVKEPGTRERTPVASRSCRTGRFSGDQICTLWLALDPGQRRRVARSSTCAARIDGESTTTPPRSPATTATSTGLPAGSRLRVAAATSSTSFSSSWRTRRLHGSPRPARCTARRAMPAPGPAPARLRQPLGRRRCGLRSRKET